MVDSTGQSHTPEGEKQKFLMEQSLKKPNKKKPMSCAFCKSSNELEELKDSQNHVMCPILYILKCLPSVDGVRTSFLSSLNKF